ncbi:uncharacterized protein LOC120812510 isoform X1 [Gasterosteus aculeatus]
MFNWVVKVAPQPPEAPGTDDAAKTPAGGSTGKQPPQKNSDENSEDSQAQEGVLGWLSNGFVSALPRPSASPRLSRFTSDAKPGEDGERSGVIGWVTQGLTKLLPQPEEKYKEAENNDEPTEIYEVETMPDFDPLPHIPVVEILSEDESEVETPQFPPNVVTWINRMVPQPILLSPGAVPIEPSSRASHSSLDKSTYTLWQFLSPPPESLSGISLDTDSKASAVVGWFVSGLGLKMPQPALPSRDNAESATEVLQKASSKLRLDLVLEDVDSDNEDEHKLQDQSRAAALTREVTQPAQADPQPESPDSVGRSQEDAETQRGRWTPFIENIKKKAEGAAFANMEERLLQERVDVARIAEEVARETAETAIRQRTREGHSINLSLGSKGLLQEEPEVELPVEQEEESEVDQFTE